MRASRASIGAVALAVLSVFARPESAHAQPKVTPPHAVTSVPSAPPEDVQVDAPTRVLLEITVSAEGGVTDPVVVESEDPRLDAEALRRVKGLRFEPARRDGQAVAARVRYEVVFAASPRVEREPAAPSSPVVEAPVAPSVPDVPAPSQQKKTKQPEVFEAEARVEAPVREAARYTVRGGDLTTSPGTRGDAFRAIEALPGVSRPPAGQGEPILRGVSGFESAVLIDGVQVPLLYHFGGLTSVVSSRLLDRIDVYPSNFSVRYGRVVGGVVEAHTRDPKSDRLHAMLDLSLLDSSALVEAPLGRDTGVAVAARRSNLDLYFGALASTDAFSVVAAPVYWDYQLLGAHRFSKNHQLRVLAFGSRDRIELQLSKPLDDDPVLRGDVGGAIEFHRVSVESRAELGGGTSQSLLLSVGRMNFEQKAGPDISGSFVAYNLDARAEWRVPIHPSLGLRFGVDAQNTFYDGDYSGSRPPQLEGDPSINEPNTNQPHVDIADTFSQVAPAGYLELSIAPTPEVELIPGIRVDYFRQIHALSVDPRLAARVKVAAETTLKGGVGLFTQQPQYFEDIPGIGNADLDPGRAIHQSVGVEQGFGEVAHVSVEAFHRRLFDRVVATQGGAPPYFVNDGSGRVFGLELFGRFRPTRSTQGTLSYTLSRSERRDRDGAWRLFDQDQTHNLVATLRQDLGAGWEVGARFRLVTGNPRTPIRGSVFDATTGLYRPLYGAVGSERDPTFHQLDLLAQKTWQLPGFRLSAYLDLQNADNSKNPEGRSYSYDYQKSEDVQGLPIFPNLGLRGEL